MKVIKKQKGQTLIETAFILMLLLLIVFGITELSRAWFTKNSLKNAARQGARVAAVTLKATLPTASIACNSGTGCPNSNVITNATCCQPGTPRKEDTYNTSVSMFCGTDGTKNCTTVVADDPIKVRVQSTFFFAIGGERVNFFGMKIWPWPQSMVFTEEATMRYEL